jgi:hypothetical protein
MECQCPTKEQEDLNRTHTHHNTTALYPFHTNTNLDEEEADPTADPTGTMPEPSS